MPVAVFIVLLIIGLLLLLMGLFLYRDEKIDFIHSYHHKNVAEKDKGRFCRRIGVGLGIAGLGVMAWGFVNYFAKVDWGVAFMIIGLVAGLWLIIGTVKKFNGTVF